MDVRYKRIGNNLYNVCSFEDYVENRDAYNPSLTAIELDNGYIYPIRSKYDPNPGIYVGKDISLVNFPTENKSQYLASNTIDFNNLDGIRDAMKKDKMVKDMQNEILSNGNNITHFNIDPDDKPMMVGIKTSWNKKNGDFDSYAYRFGSNFNNDKRLLNKHDISLSKAISICTNSDIKITVTFEDMSPDVPNPMREPVTVVLNGGDINNE